MTGRYRKNRSGTYRNRVLKLFYTLCLRHDRNMSKIEHDRYFVYRRPLLPINFLDAVLKKYADVDPADYPEALAELLRDEHIAGPLRICSPALFERLANDVSRQKAAPNLLVVLRYLVRMSTRATPFAAYACVGIGRIAEERDGIARPCAASCYIDIDSNVLLEFDGRIKRTVPRDEETRVRSANIVYEKGKSIRFIERRLAKAQMYYELAKTDRTDFLALTLAELRTSKTVREIVDLLAAKAPNIARRDIADYIFRLVDGGVLQVDLDLRLTTGRRLDDYLTSLVNAIPVAESTAEYRILKKISSTIGSGVAHDIGTAAACVSRAESLLKEAGGDFPSGQMFHVDAYCDGAPRLVGERELRHLSKAISTLESLVSRPVDTTFGEIRQSLESRFGNEFVPLMVALDPESGISFGYSKASTKWTDGLNIKPKNAKAGPTMEMLYHALASKSAGMNGQAIDLDDAFGNTEGLGTKISGSFSACITLYEDGSGDANGERHPLMALNFLHGPGATKINARFGARHAGIENALRETAQREDRHGDEIAYAEVVHLPSPRHANIASRPSIRPYEIVLSGSSDVPADHQIRPDELAVAVIGSDIVLWSTRLNKRVVPRFSSAYNFKIKTNLGLYQFFCVLAASAAHLPNFQWPNSLYATPFLPRVTCGDVIVSRARWHLDKSAIDRICKHIEAQDWEALRNLFAEKMLPPWFSIQMNDNLLEIERDNRLSLALLGDEIGGKSSVVLTEAPARLGRAVLRCNDDAWHSEIVLPLHVVDSGAGAEATVIAHSTFVLRNAVHDLLKAPEPRANWHYMKLYGGEDYLEGLAAGDLATILRQAHQQGLVKRWFFIRYRDPEFHIRLRLEGEGQDFNNFVHALQHNLLEPLLRKHELSGYKNDNYLPEYSRYGGRKVMQHVEDIFFNDSVYCLAMIRKARELQSDELVWKAAISGVLDYMKSFRLSPQQVRRFIAEQRRAFLSEMQIEKTQFDALGTLYKKHRRYLETIVSGPENAAPHIAQALEARRSANTGPCDAIMAAIPGDNILIVLSSIVHMQANRIFTGNSRPQEFIVWDFLDRATRSVAARRDAEAAVSLGSS